MRPEARSEIHSMPMEEVIRFWDFYEKEGRKKKQFLETVRDLVQNDLFYLLVRVCQRKDMLHPWIYDRTREVEKEPYGYLDLWAREHYKSTIITFGKTIQDVLKDPNMTTGIFSHTRPIAKAFLRQIMRELEGNKILNDAFPDILWGEKLKDAPKWSEDEGIIVKRQTNPNEATIEAWGVVDGQPTSKHFKKLLYDDVVVRDSVTNEEMMAKTMQQLELSYNLGSVGGFRVFVGTRWHFNDAYRTLIDRQTVKPRVYPGREDGEEEGKSVYWPEEVHIEKRRDMGPYSYASQILLNPRADALQGFKREWLRTYTTITPAQSKRFNKYILVDPSSEKKKGSDYTAMFVVGLGGDENYYILDIVRDRLNLTERAERLFTLHRKWKPIEVRYEKYGLQADVEHIKSRQEKEMYRFDIREVGGNVKKSDRIGRLIPLFEQGKVYFPQTLHTTDYQKQTVDLVRSFIEEEFVSFPVGLHDDLLDALSRICEPELKLKWPKDEKVVTEPRRTVNRNSSNTAWMA